MNETPAVNAHTAVASCVMPAAAPSVPAVRRLCRCLAAAWELPEESRDALSVIVTELVTNAVVHSGSPDVALLLTRRRDAVVIDVRDHGRWIPPEPGPPAAPALAPPCHGRGLTLVRAYARCCAVRGGEAGTSVTAEVPCRPVPPRQASAPTGLPARAPRAALL